MTPAARVQAAVMILDRILAGDAAEKALTNWARHSRFAGSKDRAAIRDHVFDALRCRRSFACLGGAETGRGLMIGALRAAGTNPDCVFTGEGYGPAPLDADERAFRQVPDGNTALDIPDWLAPQLQAALGPDFAPVCQKLRSRAPVFLRVNTARTDRENAQAALARDAIETHPHPLAQTALEVKTNPRRIRSSRAFQDGLVELQDAASQAVVEALPLRAGMRVLDYCAGGGGKTLAMGARSPADYFAHDAAPARLRDLPARAKRAGLDVQILASATLTKAAPFDLVLCDVPCSGSGAWRRAPQGKWLLTPEKLRDLMKTQAQILDDASKIIVPGGWLAYVTCALLQAENEQQIAAFLARSAGWSQQRVRRISPLEGGDGFFVALLRRA